MHDLAIAGAVASAAAIVETESAATVAKPIAAGAESITEAAKPAATVHGWSSSFDYGRNYIMREVHTPHAMWLWVVSGGLGLCGLQVALTNCCIVGRRLMDRRTRQRQRAVSVNGAHSSSSTPPALRRRANHRGRSASGFPECQCRSCVRHTRVSEPPPCEAASFLAKAFASSCVSGF